MEPRELLRKFLGAFNESNQVPEYPGLKDEALFSSRGRGAGDPSSIQAGGLPPQRAQPSALTRFSEAYAGRRFSDLLEIADALQPEERKAQSDKIWSAVADQFLRRPPAASLAMLQCVAEWGIPPPLGAGQRQLLSVAYIDSFSRSPETPRDQLRAVVNFDDSELRPWARERLNGSIAQGDVAEAEALVGAMAWLADGCCVAAWDAFTTHLYYGNEPKARALLSSSLANIPEKDRAQMSACVRRAYREARGRSMELRQLVATRGGLGPAEVLDIEVGNILRCSTLEQAQTLIADLGIAPSAMVLESLSRGRLEHHRWASHFQCGTVGEFIELWYSHRNYLKYLVEQGATPRLSRAELDICRRLGGAASEETLPIDALVAERMKLGSGIDLIDVVRTKNYGPLLSALAQADSCYKSLGPGGSLRAPVEAIGAGIFLQCIGDVSTLLGRSVDEILPIYGKAFVLAGGNAPRFLERVVKAVQQDNGLYGRWTSGETGGLHDARAEFQRIVEDGRFDIAGFHERCQKYQVIPELAPMVAKFRSLEDVFASWRSLRQFAKVESALRDEAFLATLLALRTAEPKLYECLKTLYFHPDSNVDSATLRQLVESPKAFFGRSARYTDETLHDAVKPSRMLEIPQLDLSAADLRAALIGGAYDGLQRFTPMEIEYRFPTKGPQYATAREAIEAALGSRSKGIKGRAQDDKKLFSLMSAAVSGDAVCAAEGRTFLKYVKEGMQLPPAVEARLLELAYDPVHGMPETWMTLLATLHRKSDPIGILAGEDTACCMPFGEGKALVYWCDPAMALLTVRLQNEDGGHRTIAQSVVSRDAPSSLPLSSFLAQLRGRTETPLAHLMKQVSCAGPLVTALDNVEPAKNFTWPELNARVQQVIRDFFAEQSERYGAVEGMNPDWVAIGREYTKMHGGLETVPDHLLPIGSPASYSDRAVGQMAGTVYQLRLQGPRPLHRTVRAPELSMVGRVVSHAAGISDLRVVDLLPVALVQSSELKRTAEQHGVQGLKVRLTAIEVNNAHKKRPTLGVKHVNSAGEVDGYLIAFEGRSEGRAVVLVDDLGVNGESRSKVLSALVAGFAERFTTAYPDPAHAPKVRVRRDLGQTAKLVRQQLAKNPVQEMEEET